MPHVTLIGADDDQSILIHHGSGRIDGHRRERCIIQASAVPAAFSRLALAQRRTGIRCLRDIRLSLRSPC
jgi:hypothetical protein